MKKIITLLVVVCVYFNSNAQQTFVPDDNFEQALIDLGYDSGALDNYVPTQNIVNITSLNITNKAISDLTGIKSFTNLMYLHCSNNNLTSLDLTANYALRLVYCGDNSLTSLDVSSSISLTFLRCYNNNLTELKLNQNINLRSLFCYENELTTLDLSTNHVLQTLFCNSNNLTSLDVSSNISLRQLRCQNNNLTELDLSQNTILKDLFCADNELTELDLSMIPTFERVSCFNNNLITLNIKNGYNSNIYVFFTINNPNLSCIEVDNEVYSTTNWTSIDATSNFSENCHYNQTFVPDDNFEQVLIDLGYDYGALDNYVPTANIENVTLLSISYENIFDLTGIEDFTNLTSLYCHGNNLTELDLSNNNKIKSLNISHNNIKEIILNENSPIEYFNCLFNQLSFLDVTSFIKLEIFLCANNQIKSLNLENNINLYYFLCNNNRLYNLNLKNGNNTNIHNSINLKNNPDLACVQVDYENYSTTFWTNKDSQTFYSSSYCQHSMANTTSNTILRETKITKDNHKQLVLEKLIIANSNESTIYIKTKNNSKISELKMYDVLGKLVFEASPNKSEISIPTTINKGSILFVKAQLENGEILNSKFIKH